MYIHTNPDNLICKSNVLVVTCTQIKNLSQILCCYKDSDQCLLVNIWAHLLLEIYLEVESLCNRTDVCLNLQETSQKFWLILPSCTSTVSNPH